MSFTEGLLPEWNAAGVEPPQALKDTGWVVEQKPPADYFNWYMYNTYRALLELQQKAAEKTDIVTLEDASLTKKGIVQLSNSISSTSETLAATSKAVKLIADALSTKETPAGAQLKIDHASYKVARSNKDAEGIFTTVEYRRKSDDTLAARSVLSGGTSPEYTTRTVTFYAADGTTVARTDVFTISYDADGEWVGEA